MKRFFRWLFLVGAGLFVFGWLTDDGTPAWCSECRRAGLTADQSAGLHRFFPWACREFSALRRGESRARP